MIPSSITTVDVREMTCAQALAVVAKALEKLAPGEALEVQFSTEDVRSDLIVWALGRSVGVQDAAKEALRLTKTDATPRRP